MAKSGKSTYKKAASSYHGPIVGKITGASVPESASKGGQKSFPMVSKK